MEQPKQKGWKMFGDKTAEPCLENNAGVATDRVATMQGLCGEGEAQCERPRLIERIVRQRCRAQKQAHKVDALAELESLLQENPAVARILELLEIVQ
jgi:hypothetical protein